MEYAPNEPSSVARFRAAFRSTGTVVGDIPMTRVEADKVASAFNADVVDLWCEELQARAELDTVMYEIASRLTTER